MQNTVQQFVERVSAC